MGAFGTATNYKCCEIEGSTEARLVGMKHEATKRHNDFILQVFFYLLDCAETNASEPLCSVCNIHTTATELQEHTTCTFKCKPHCALCIRHISVPWNYF